MSNTNTPIQIKVDISETASRFIIAVLIVLLIAGALVLDGFGLKPTDILIGGLIGAFGAMVQKIFDTKTPHTDEAVAELVRKTPPASPMPGETITTSIKKEDSHDATSGSTAGGGTQVTEAAASTTIAPADANTDASPWPFGVGEEGKSDLQG